MRPRVTYEEWKEKQKAYRDKNRERLLEASRIRRKEKRDAEGPKTKTPRGPYKTDEQKAETKRLYNERRLERGNNMTPEQKEAKREWNRKYKRDNAEAIKQKNKIYFDNNKDKARAYRAANRDKINQRTREKRLANKEQINAKIQEKRRARKLADPSYRLRCSLGSRISMAVKRQRTRKIGRTLWLTGCTVEQLKQHLEKLFQPGMNWENYNHAGWHVDHIIPCAAFDLSDSEQQKACFHYSNLQPMWAVDNWKKAGLVDYRPQPLKF